MTDDLDALRPEVREALKSIEFACTVRYSGEDEYAIIRAELLRLAGVEAELAALKARIAEAPIGMVVGGAEGNRDNTDSYRVDVTVGWESSLADKRVRLMVVEE